MSEQGGVRATWNESDRELFQLMDAMADVDESGVVTGPSPLGVLCLVGETQCGKSTLIQDWTAQRDWRLLTVMPGIDSPGSRRGSRWLQARRAHCIVYLDGSPRLADAGFMPAIRCPTTSSWSTRHQCLI